MATVSAENPFADANTKTTRQNRDKKKFRMYIPSLVSRTLVRDFSPPFSSLAQTQRGLRPSNAARVLTKALCIEAVPERAIRRRHRAAIFGTGSIIIIKYTVKAVNKKEVSREK
jgi:hypothetical protein